METAETLVQGYMNIYRSGFYHRKGKANAYDRHAGDIYPSWEAAVDDIDPISHYIDTVIVSWHEAAQPVINGPDSKPVSLKLTRYADAEVSHA